METNSNTTAPSFYERQLSAVECEIECILYLRATRPSGFDWESHVSGYADDVDPDDDGSSAHTAARAALVDFGWQL